MNLEELFQQQINAGDTVLWYMLQQVVNEQTTVSVRKHKLSDGPVSLIQNDLAEYVYKESNGQGWPLFVKD